MLCPSPASPARSVFFGEVWPRRGPCLRLHGWGRPGQLNSKPRASVRFKREVVLRRLVLGIEDHLAQSTELWGYGSFVCGQQKGKERWCRGLELIAEDARASKRHGAGRGTFYTDVGDSFRSIDELVFHSVPPEGLLLGAMAISVAKEAAEDGKEETVILLRRQKAQRVEAPLFEASLETISANAAVWNAEQILEHQLRLSRYATLVEPLTTRAKYQAKIYTKMSEEAIRRADPRRSSLSKLSVHHFTSFYIFLLFLHSVKLMSIHFIPFYCHYLEGRLRAKP